MNGPYYAVTKNGQVYHHEDLQDNNGEEILPGAVVMMVKPYLESGNPLGVTKAELDYLLDNSGLKLPPASGSMPLGGGLAKALYETNDETKGPLRLQGASGRLGLGHSGCVRPRFRDYLVQGRAGVQGVGAHRRRRPV